MPTATIPALTEDQLDDLLYLARTGETTDLTVSIEAFAKSSNTAPPTILAATVDPQSGNGMLHMAAANGHTETLKTLLSVPLSQHSLALALNIQNSSGNTPLHWAALNGHVEAVKVLVAADADASLTNKAGKDAIYEAEANGKNEVAEWLLTEGKWLERGVSGSGGKVEDGVVGEGAEDGAEGEEGSDDVVMKEGESGQGG